MKKSVVPFTLSLLVGFVTVLALDSWAQADAREPKAARLPRFRIEQIAASPERFQILRSDMFTYLCRKNKKGRIQVNRVQRITPRGIVRVKSLKRKKVSKLRPLCQSMFDQTTPPNPDATPTPAPTPAPTGTPTPVPTPIPGFPLPELSIGQPLRLQSLYGPLLSSVSFSGTCNPQNGSVLSTDLSIFTKCKASGSWSLQADLSEYSPGIYDFNFAQGENSMSIRIVIRGSAPCTDPEPLIHAIRTTAELDLLRSTTLLGEIFAAELCADLDLQNQEWEPLPNFGKLFDGQGHTISNLRVSSNPLSEDAGLFKSIGFGIVRDLRVANAFVEGSHKVGILAGSFSGEILNVEVEGEARGHSSVGGVFGSGFDVKLSNVSADVSVAALQDAAISGVAIGGIVGNCYGCSVRQTHSSGQVSGYALVGGIAGWLTESSVTTSYSNAAVSTEEFPGSSSIPSEGAGGLVGLSKLSILSVSYSEGAVQGSLVAQTSGVGGLVGISEASSLASTYAVGVVTGYRGISGLIGIARPHVASSTQNTTTSVIDSYSASIVVPQAISGVQGGIVGSIDQMGSFEGAVQAEDALWVTELNTGASKALNPDSYGLGVSVKRLRNGTAAVGFPLSDWEIGADRYPRLRGLPNSAVEN